MFLRRRTTDVKVMIGAVIALSALEIATKMSASQLDSNIQKLNEWKRLNSENYVNLADSNKESLNISDMDLESLKFYKSEKLYNTNESYSTNV